MMVLLPFLTLLFLLSILNVQCAGNKYRVSSQKSAQKTQTPKKPPLLNTDGLPSLKEILDGLDLSEFYPNLVKMGVVETRFLLRLSSMDFRMMTLEWEGFTVENMVKLKNEASALFARATVTEQPNKEEYNLRNKQKYGRIYIENSVQSYEFVVATYGGPPPTGRLTVVLADSVVGCEAANKFHPQINYQQNVLLLRRGECSFLTKSINAKRFNASVLIIANTEDSLEPAASGYGIDKNVTEMSVLSLGNFPTLSVSNTSWAKLISTVKFNLPLMTSLQIVPLYCKSGGTCSPVLEEEKKLQSEVQCGILRTKSSQGEVRSFDFLTSNFGSILPVRGHLTVKLANPIDACEPLLPGDYENTVVLAHRGVCRFDKKALHAQEAGARMLMVAEVEDNSLQRLGGYQPDSGYVGIPSVLVTAPSGRQLEEALKRPNVSVSVEVIPSKDSLVADSWIDLSFTAWSEVESDLMVQLEGLIQKYSQLQHQEIVAWLRRKLDGLSSLKQKPMDTDERFDNNDREL